VELLREEMRRVIRYLLWEVTTWEGRAAEAAERQDVGVEARGGLEGYALAQAEQCRKLSDHFRTEWSLSVDRATNSVLGADDGLVSAAEAGGVLDSLFAPSG
jgi:hypothetical protein